MRRSYAATALVFVLGACRATETHHPPPDAAVETVRTAEAHEEELPLIHRTSGTVRGRNTTVVTSKTMGYVRDVRVRPGDLVKAGEPLVDLEANDVRASVARAHAALGQSNEAKAEAESALAASRAAARVAKTSFDRAGQLLADKAIPQQQYDDAEARWLTAQAQEQMAQARVRAVGGAIEEAKASLSMASATLGYAAIVAPFAGRVLERRVDPGALAAPGTPLLTIADEGALRVEAALEESRADAISLGDEAWIELEPVKMATAVPTPSAAPAEGKPNPAAPETTASKPGTRRLLAKINEIVPNVDVASRAILVKLELPPDAGPLRPGTFARVGFRVGTRSRLVVPTGAITSFGALDRVFVVEDGRARLRMITRGETEGQWTEVLSGLAPHEKVVDAPPMALRDGTAVRVQP